MEAKHSLLNFTALGMHTLNSGATPQVYLLKKQHMFSLPSPSDVLGFCLWGCL